MPIMISIPVSNFGDQSLFTLFSLFSEMNGITVGKGLLAKNSDLKSRMKAFDY